MGLACSSAIASALGGDITLKKSNRGLTAFAFKIPVQSPYEGFDESEDTAEKLFPNNIRL
jgi:K+-sensing histidine kinase KdpD